MADILEKILAVKAQEVAAAKERISLDEIKLLAQKARAPRGFARALQAKIDAGKSAVIAEVKKASPSKGVICENFQPACAAQDYEKNGAACLSVLTDRQFFQGSQEALEAVNAAVSIPLLRKDFMIDAYQVYEARSWGADAILVIMRALDDAKAAELSSLAVDLGMDVLVETHDEEEIARALKLPAKLIGINNRNLRTFVTDIAQTLELKHLVSSDRLLVTESGVGTVEDVARLKAAGVNAFLVGEAFMRHASPGAALTDLFGDLR